MLYLFASSVIPLSITHQPSFSGLLGNLLHLTVSVVIGLNVSILAGLLQPIGGILNVLGILHIFIGIGISISL